MLVVNVVNRSETEAIPADLELQSGAFTGQGRVHLITAASLEATNTATAEMVRTMFEILKKQDTTLSSLAGLSGTPVQIDQDTEKKFKEWVDLSLLPVETRLSFRLEVPLTLTERVK